MQYFKKSISKDELIKLVDDAADIIRTAVDYKFILVLLFLKRLSDKAMHEREKVRMMLKDKGLSNEQIEEELEQPEYYRVYIPRSCLWDEVTRDVNNLPNNLADAINEIAKRNDYLQGVINKVDFMEFTRNQENRELLRKLINLFDRYEFDDKVEEDIFGDAYEHILMRFAPEKAREGEIYTPRAVIRLLVELLEPKPESLVYDPCCGSGGMLIYSYLYVRDKYGEEQAKRLILYGQERNQEIYAICKMNLLLHGAENVHVESGDTLLYPKFREKEGKGIKRFDIVLANPPWNQDGYDEDALKAAEFRDRFVYGYTPDSSADWAWAEHMLASAKDDGRVGLVIDNGCLFRGGREQVIRSKILDKDLVECVILLPERLFYNTGAPGAILVFRKRKPTERKGRILFINASNEYIKHPTVRRLNSLSDENIKRIVDAYKSFKDIEDFAKVVSLDKVKANDYNLNVTLYVMPAYKEEEIDVVKEFEELKVLEEERRGLIERLEHYIEQIKEANR